MVTLPPEIRAAIEAHAVEDYPNEACGFVLGEPGPEGALVRAVRARNVQDDYHARLPEEFPRTARTAYFIEPKEILRAFDDAKNSGLDVRILYHSHTDHDAYFSDTDRAAAMFGDEPAYPVDYLVVSVRDKRCKAIKLFRWGKEDKRFEEVALG